MNNQVEKLIAIAESDLGYKESPPNSNRTKYGKWYGLDGNPWCMMAVVKGVITREEYEIITGDKFIQ